MTEIVEHGYSSESAKGTSTCQGIDGHHISLHPCALGIGRVKKDSISPKWDSVPYIPFVINQ